jgi:DNA-binding MarR family transcriptional regulator
VTEPSLNVLLSRALISLTRAYGRADPDAPTLPFYAVVLRVLDHGGIDLREIPARARISKRAVTTLIKQGERAGLVTNEAKVVRLTDAGVRARTAAENALRAAESEWIVAMDAASLRGALETVVGGFELEHPHYVCTYGGADMSAVGGRYPGHGQDWKPVRREGSETARNLPLSALLSQALMDFTIRYEAGFTWALSSTVHSLLPFPDEGYLFSEAPEKTWLSGTGNSLLERHGLVEVDDGGGDKKQRRATLLTRGTFARDAYEGNVARVEKEWRDAYGDAAITALRDALTNVAAKLEPGLADHPLMSWSGGFREASGELT